MGTEQPSRFIFFDTETNEGKPNEKGEIKLTLRLGWLCYKDRLREEWFYFETEKQFWKKVYSLIKPHTKTIFIAHNIAFDFRILKGFSELKKSGYKKKRIYFQGSTNVFIYEKAGYKRLDFIDDMNFFKVPLAVLGDNIGMPKMDVDFKTASDKKLSVYCKNDVAIMVKAWDLYLTFLSEHKLGNFCNTIASQAFTAYRTRFMKKEIYIHTEQAVIDDERSAYHGGRVEAFFIGKASRKNLYYNYDVNSMYPSVMNAYRYPTRFIKTMRNIPVRGLYTMLDKGYLLCGVFDIKTDDPAYPVSKDGKMYYPVGSFTTYLTTREIEYALEHGHIKSCERLRVYEGDYIFREYVKFFYTLKAQYRKEGNDAFTLITKLFLNSLYGKFGQRVEITEPVKKYFPFDGRWFDANTNKKYVVFDGDVREIKGLGEGYESMVAIPAHITADARIKLWRTIKKLGLKNCYYCDTDSVITTKKMPTGAGLGEWSLKDTSKDLAVYGPKDYVFKGVEVIKGVSRKAKKLGDGHYGQVQFEGLAGASVKNRLDTVIIKNIEKHLVRSYDKGVVLSTGRVKPFML